MGRIKPSAPLTAIILLALWVGGCNADQSAEDGVMHDPICLERPRKMNAYCDGVEQ